MSRVAIVRILNQNVIIHKIEKKHKNDKNPNPRPSKGWDDESRVLVTKITKIWTHGSRRTRDESSYKVVAHSLIPLLTDTQTHIDTYDHDYG